MIRLVLALLLINIQLAFSEECSQTFIKQQVATDTQTIVTYVTPNLPTRKDLSCAIGTEFFNLISEFPNKRSVLVSNKEITYTVSWNLNENRFYFIYSDNQYSTVYIYKEPLKRIKESLLLLEYSTLNKSDFLNKKTININFTNLLHRL